MGLSPRLKLAINYFLGPLLFIVIAYSIYRQVLSQPDLRETWAVIKHRLLNGGLPWLLAAILFMLLNWGIEAIKWRKLVAVALPISFGRAFRSVLSGVSFTMLTPNRMGEFLGRVFYLPDGSRVRTAFLTMLGSLSQLSVTLFAGMLGIVYLYAVREKAGFVAPGEAISILLTAAIGGLSITLLLLFNIGWLIRVLERVPQLTRYLSYLHLLGTISKRILLQLLGLSGLRYLVFWMQYLFIFQAIDLPIGIGDVLAGTAVLFLVLAVIPSIALAELGIRGKVSLFIFGLFTTNTLGILVVSAIIWVINIVVPAALGSLLIIKVKLFANGNKQSATASPAVGQRK